MKSAATGLLVVWLLFGSFMATNAQEEGPLLPGLETTSPVAEPPEQEPAPKSAPAPPAAPVLDFSEDADDGITPLDEHGRPMRGPEPTDVLRLPPPPVAEEPEFAAPAPSLDENEAPRKPNLWQRSTEAVRELAKPVLPGQNRPTPSEVPTAKPSAPKSWFPRAPWAKPQTVPPAQASQARTAVPQARTQVPQARSTVQPQPSRADRPQASAPATSALRPAAPPIQSRQMPSSRRQQMQSSARQAVPQARPNVPPSPSRRRIPPGAREAKNTPRSPWER